MKTKFFLLLAITTFMTACSTSPSKQALNQDSLPMSHIYQQQMKKNARTQMAQLRADLPPVTVDGIEVSTVDEHYSSVYRLPNPDITLWVQPRLLANNELIHPGYRTHFRLYERTPYALPGEVSTGLH